MKLLSRCARYSLLLIISLVLAIFMLTLTTDISVYQSADEIQTLGLKTWSGLPVPYKFSAPGMDWVQYDWWRMLASMLIWLSLIFFGLRGVVKYRLTRQAAVEN